MRDALRSAISTRFCLLTCLFVQTVATAPGVCLGSNAQPSESVLFQHLLENGVRHLADDSFQVPQPLFIVDKDRASREEAMKKTAGRFGWQRFSKESVHAPVVVQTNSFKNDQDEIIGHSLHSAFIAYAPMEKLKDSDLQHAVFGNSHDGADGESLIPLTDNEYAALGIGKSAEGLSTFGKVEFPLFNRVSIEGTVRYEFAEHEGFLLAWELSPRFSRDESILTDLELNNRWSKLSANELGQLVKSEPNPYLGCGGYLTIHPTGLTENQLWVETHLVIYEPKDWFDGGKFLRLKLPVMAQESARSLRRKLPKE